MNILSWAAASVGQRGVVETAKIVGMYGMDLLFDWRYGTDTMRWIRSDTLETESENRSHSHPYKATKTRPFLRLLNQLDVPWDGHFLDIGSGKGRVLLMAAQSEFRKVIGIEFSAPLCHIARQNVELFARQHPRLAPIEVLEADATKYAFQREDCVIFMFNPFDQVMLAQVLNNLRASLAQHPRSIVLIYNDPAFHELVMQSGCFASSTSYHLGGTHFEVYANATGSSAA